MNRLMNTRTVYTTIAAVTLAAGLAGVAYASNDSDKDTARPASPQATATAAGPASAPLAMEEVLTRLRTAGYTDFKEMESKNGRYEVKGRNAEGRRVELYVDARDGKVLKEERDD